MTAPMTSPLRLAVLCPHFAPDVAPTGEVMTRIVLELAARGHELHVVTALPWYQHHRIEPLVLTREHQRRRHLQETVAIRRWDATRPDDPVTDLALLDQ